MSRQEEGKVDSFKEFALKELKANLSNWLSEGSWSPVKEKCLKDIFTKIQTRE